MDAVIDLEEQLLQSHREKDYLKRQVEYAAAHHSGEVLSLQRENRRLRNRLSTTTVILIITILVLLTRL